MIDTKKKTYLKFVVYRPIFWHRSRCHADNRLNQQMHVTAPGVARRGSSEYTW